MEQIKVDLALDKTFLLHGNKQVAYLMVKLAAPEQIVKERPVQNFSFVIDRSGSMSGEKLDYTKKAVTFAVGHLRPQDYCSVVAFDDMVTMVAPSHKVENKDALKMAVESIYPGGSTNLSGGMLLGLREVKLAHKENQINRVLLLTDGMANVGVTDHGAWWRRRGKWQPVRLISLPLDWVMTLKKICCRQWPRPAEVTFII
ncbi:hypothetical protein P378_09395 [Desulforamulus profundi]|uniref:VWFA domain-containing protein n=1 Tax=Desulforamulus profundi TaxID=1383067 RepID=A0A2C6L2N7_9FIRM|nr:VWA domain-containing protein [Desulforamulus profundi]PHJ38481.1 hypothetical protein P378_09395 [Desulforamulus profundi]